MQGNTGFLKGELNEVIEHTGLGTNELIKRKRGQEQPNMGTRGGETQDTERQSVTYRCRRRH